MKIFKLLFLSILISMTFSCDDNDELYTLNPQGSGMITAPESGFTQVLNPEEEQTNTAFALVWNTADYDIPVEILYNVEFAKSETDFAEPFLAGSTSNTNMSWSISAFNSAVVGAGLLPFAEGSMDIRVVSTVGSGSAPQISESITVLITPFTTDLPTIAVPGNHQGWNPPEAPLLAASAFGETDFEGYVWLDGEFKFLAPDSAGNFEWGSVDWGDDGTFTGKLVDEGEVNCNAASAGYYFVKANTDTETLTYSTDIMNWGLIGGSIPGTGWDSDLDMTYDSATQTLKITLDLVNPAADGGIKFRANDAWDINFGDNDADGSLELGGANIEVPSDGNYTVTLDLSNPRDYTYSLVKN